MRVTPPLNSQLLFGEIINERETTNQSCQCLQKRKLVSCGWTNGWLPGYLMSLLWYLVIIFVKLNIQTVGLIEIRILTLLHWSMVGIEFQVLKNSVWLASYFCLASRIAICNLRDKISNKCSNQLYLLIFSLCVI